MGNTHPLLVGMHTCRDTKDITVMVRILGIGLLHDPAILLLGICPKENSSPPQRH